MKPRWVLFGFAAASFCCLSSKAAYVVTTNMNGADAEVRESDINPNTDAALGPLGVPFGTNRGTSTELATRAKDSTANSGDRSSLIYLKFDISDANGVTDALLNMAARTPLQMTTRNSANLKWNRIYHRNPYYGTLPADDTNPDYVAFASDPANYTRTEFKVYGLQNFSHPNYDWSESGVPATWDPVASPTYGPLGSITFFNAPGITPDSRLTPVQDPGKYNINSDMRLLGTATIEDPGLPAAVPPPYPSLQGAGSAAHCVGCLSFDFQDTAGDLHDLIKEARMEGQTYVTLAVHFALDAFQNDNGAGETSQITPNDFLNFNYLFNPKEMDANTSLDGFQLNSDPNWDPDWSDNGPTPYDPINDPTPIGPGPYSSANNDNGFFSPSLVFLIPEPGSFVLLALGVLALASAGRRK